MSDNNKKSTQVDPNDLSDLGGKPVLSNDLSDLGGVPVNGMPVSRPGEALLGGAEQGLTAGLSDELTGAIGAGVDKVMGTSATNKQLADQGFTGDIGPQSTLDTYRQGRDAERARLASLQQSNPLISFAGNVGGGILGMKGLGMLNGAPAVAASAETGAIPVQTVGQKALNFLQKAGGATAKGAGFGALAGLTAGDADLTKGEYSKAADQIKEGGELGAITGGVLQTAASGVSAGAKALASFPIVKDAVTAFKGAYAGKEYTGKVNQYLADFDDLAKKTYRYLNNFAKEKFDAKTEALATADRNGIIVDLTEDYKNILDQTNNMPEATPAQAEAKRQMKQTFTGLLEGVKTTVQPEPIPVSYSTMPTKEKTTQHYQEVVDNFKELQRKLDMHSAKLAAEGTLATPNIVKSQLPSGENILIPQLIKNDNEQGLNLSTLNPVPAQTVVDKTRDIETSSPGVGKTYMFNPPPQEQMSMPPQTQMKPSDLNEFIQSSEDLAPDADLKATKAQKLGTQIPNILKRRLEDVVPNLPELNKGSSDAMQLFERLTGKELPKTFDKTEFSPSDQRNIEDRLSKILQRSDAPAKLEDALTGFEGNNRKISGIAAEDPQAANYIRNKSQELNKNMQLTKLADSGAKLTTDPAKALGGLGGMAVKTGENAGKLTKYVGGKVDELDSLNKKIGAKIGEAITPQNWINKGTQVLTEAEPEELTAMAKKGIERFGPDFQKYSNVLTHAAQKPGPGRSAIMFSLMQQPEFREFAHGIFTSKDNNPDQGQ